MANPNSEGVSIGPRWRLNMTPGSRTEVQAEVVGDVSHRFVVRD